MLPDQGELQTTASENQLNLPEAKMDAEQPARVISMQDGDLTDFSASPNALSLSPNVLEASPLIPERIIDVPDFLPPSSDTEGGGESGAELSAGERRGSGANGTSGGTLGRFLGSILPKMS